MNRTKTTLLSLLAVFLVGISHVQAQKGKNDDVGNPNEDLCQFGNDVFMIGEQSPNTGQLYTYTLQNADPTERKIWKVQGAYQIDGQLASAINNEVTKPGNSIDIIWDGTSPNPNGKIVVRKELPCMAQMMKPEIVFPIQAIFKKNCHENITTTEVYPCPLSSVDYFYDGPTDCTTNEFHWGFNGSYRFSFDGGTTWNAGCHGWCGADGGRTITIQWYDADDAEVVCKPTGNNECCDGWLSAPANKEVSRGVTVLGAGIGSVEGVTITDPALSEYYTVYTRYPFDETTETVVGNTTGTPFVPIFQLDFDLPIIGQATDFEWSAHFPTASAYLIHGVDGDPLNERHNEIYLNSFTNNEFGYLKCMVTFSNGCVREYRFEVEGLNYNPCTPANSIVGNNIPCSRPEETKAYTVTGGNHAQEFLWNIPASWTALTGVAQSGGFVTTSKTIYVNTHGNAGTISVTPQNYSGCFNAYTYWTVNRLVSVYDDLGEPVIDKPACIVEGAYTTDIPNYHIDNGINGITYTWFFHDFDRPLNTPADPGPDNPFKTTSFGNGKISSWQAELEQGVKNYSITVHADKCHSPYMKSVQNGRPTHWLATSNPDPALNCGSISAIVANPNGAPDDGATVDDSFIGVAPNELDDWEEIEPVVKDVVFGKVENTEAVEQASSIASLFPNPASSQVFIKGNYTSFGLYNVQGKRLMSGSFSNGQNVIDVANIPNGIYFVKLTDYNEQKISKIHIVH